MALARTRYGHNVAVGTKALNYVMPPRPDPLPEVEYFGVSFYSPYPWWAWWRSR